MNKLDMNNEWVKYHGSIPYLELHNIYKGARLGVFASSCENMPNILLETMASGLPIVCSDKGLMPEVLGDAGVCFNPEQPTEIYHALRIVIDDPQLRLEKENASFFRAQKYSWDICAFETFSFLEQVVTNHQQSLCAE